MMIRIPRAAIESLCSLIEEHLRLEYSWPGGESFDDVDLDELNFVEFLYAALEYVRDAHPWIGRGGVVVEAAEHVRDPASADLFGALYSLAPRTPDAVLAAMVEIVPLEIVDASCGRRAAAPRKYKHLVRDFPEVLEPPPGATEFIFWYEHTFGVVEEAGWLLDPGKRSRVFASIQPYYEQLSFVEIDRESARRLACFLLAGPERRATFEARDQEAQALLSLLGPGSRFFSNCVLGEDELRDPFAHGEKIDLGADGWCAGGSFLVLLVSNGRQVAQLDQLWDTWSE